MHEKSHWNKKCKQKQSQLFNFCNVFDLLTSKTEKIVRWAPVFKSEEDFIVSYLLKCRLKTLLTNTLLSTSWVHLIFASAKISRKKLLHGRCCVHNYWFCFILKLNNFRFLFVLFQWWMTALSDYKRWHCKWFSKIWDSFDTA